MRPIIIFAAIGFAGVSGAAIAADPASRICAETSAKDVDVEGLSELLEKNVADDGTLDHSGDDAIYERLYAPVHAPLAACTETYHWSDAKADAGAAYVAAIATKRAADVLAKKHKIDAIAVEHAYRALPADVAIDLAADDITDSTIDAFTAALTKQGIDTSQEEDLTVIGMMAAALAHIDKSLAVFDAN